MKSQSKSGSSRRLLVQTSGLPRWEQCPGLAGGRDANDRIGIGLIGVGGAAAITATN